MNDLTKTAVRNFNIAYLLSLVVLGALAVAAFILESQPLEQVRSDAHVVNVAGRQRLFSERIVKLMLSTAFLPGGEGGRAESAKLERALAAWLDAHERLRHGVGSIPRPAGRSPQVAGVFDKLEADRLALADAVTRFLQATRAAAQATGPGAQAGHLTALNAARASQERYVVDMDRLVVALEQDARGRLDRARLTSAGVMAATLLVLILLGVFVMRPTSQRLRAILERLDRERKGLEGFVRESPTPIIQFNAGGEFISCNLGAERLLAQLPGPAGDHGPKALELFREYLQKFAQDPACEDLELRIADRVLLFHLVATPATGQIFALGLDITTRKEAEQAIIEARDAAEAANRLKNDFLATVNHELRTPLNAIIGFSEALVGGTYGEVAPKQKRKVEHIFNSGRRLLGLIDAMLDLSQIEAGRLTLTAAPVAVASLLGDSLHMISQSAEDKGIALAAEIAPELDGLSIDADERKLNQVLFNLLSNAVKFTPRGGAITLAAGLADGGGQLQVSIRDTGVGFTTEDGKRMFEVFAQVDSALSRQYEGSGLGLALCRRLIELHGGRIWSHSDGRNQGSTFTFAIPATPATPAAEPADAGSPDETPPALSMEFA